MATDPYRYQRLGQAKDQVRLLHRSKDARQLNITEYRLRPASLDDKPGLTALLYLWGRHSPDQPLTVDEQRSRVTESLQVALDNIKGEEPLWVDALCIDQKDDD